jgi:hypothetical protein
MVALEDGIFGELPSPPKPQGEALEFASQALSSAARQQQKAATADWHRRFAAWKREAVSAAAPILRPPSLLPVFSASDMRLEWSQWWAPEVRPDSAGKAASWLALASEAGCEEAPERLWCPPSLQQLLDALKATDGSPGFDGWTTEELKAFAIHAKWAVADLHGLRIATTSAAKFSLSEDVSRLLFTWRMAGIPKRDSPDNKPIAIGSCSKCRSFPTDSGVAKTVAMQNVDATTDWLGAPG